jgi:hypothetical protein
MSAERPCFISSAQEREFEAIVSHVLRSRFGCGEDHARGVAADLAGLSHDPDVIMRCVRADYAAIANAQPN